ncbi:hypothetical protein ACQKKK_21255 [Peribacillus sp. NPDC006672]|uniref:hypothetical protein n=1 Tax=unclassified Peribacillus TaxID=2675266 RepID=UPI00178317C5|nr:hypothetical protein [Brevibacillus sp. JNUCC-41]QOS91172.1 hypothetical protein JNUCC41_05330 [Brevibacillus sp. JNUCC-41]
MWEKVWIKIAASIGLITIGILIGSITNLMDLGDNPELNEKDNYEDLFKDNPEVFFSPNQDEMGPNQGEMPPPYQGESEDGSTGRAAKPY